MGKSCSDNLLVHIDDKGANFCKAGCPLAQTLMDGLERETEAYLQHKDGHRLPVIIRVSPLQDSSGRIVGAVETFSDSSSTAALLQRIDQLQKESLVDQLTGLANRRCIDMKLQSRIDEMKRYGWPCGVLFLDIDNFKIVNDTFGHNVGDGVLMMVARTLSNNLRAHDFLGRYGGEEFVILLEDTSTHTALQIAERIRARISSEPIHVAAQDMLVTISQGLALCGEGDDCQSILGRADQAMYRAKQAGRNCVVEQQ